MIRRPPRPPLFPYTPLSRSAVALTGLAELAKYTAWRIATAERPATCVDAVALRLHADDVAREVLHTCHQLLGAIGFCDEQDRKSTRLNSSHLVISYAVFCLK